MGKSRRKSECAKSASEREWMSVCEWTGERVCVCVGVSGYLGEEIGRAHV